MRPELAGWRANSQPPARPSSRAACFVGRPARFGGGVGQNLAGRGLPRRTRTLSFRNRLASCKFVSIARVRDEMTCGSFYPR